MTLSGELPPYPQFFFLNKFLSKVSPSYKTSLLLTSWHFPGAHPAPWLGGGSHPHPPGSRAETPHGVTQRGWDVLKHHRVPAERDPTVPCQLRIVAPNTFAWLSSTICCSRQTWPCSVDTKGSQQPAGALGLVQPFGAPRLAQDLPSPFPNSPTATPGSSATDAPGTVTCQATPCSSRCLGS